MLVMDLTHTLQHYPPPQPTRPAVDLLVIVGKHQEYLAKHGLLPARDHPGFVDALKVRPWPAPPSCYRMRKAMLQRPCSKSTNRTADF